jgi:hypothetical protein
LIPRAGFECQVNETHSKTKKTGSLYNVKNDGIGSKRIAAKMVV